MYIGQGNTIWFVESLIFFRIFCFFLVDCLSGWSQWMWLVSCRRQEMLTQGSAPDPKFKLNISSFLALLHPLYCLICAKDVIIIGLLLQMISGGKVGGWFVYVWVWVGEQGARIIFFWCFWAVVNCFFMTGAWCCVCFFVPFLLSLCLVP